MLRVVAGSLVCVTLGLVAFSCSQAGAPRDRQRVAAATPGGRHVIHSKDLRRVMKRLDRERRKSWPHKIAQEHAKTSAQERERALSEAALLVVGLAEAVARIPDAVAGIGMTEANRNTFLAQVDMLRDHAMDLSETAASGDLKGMHGVLDSITATCNACHNQFREVAVPISRR